MERPEIYTDNYNSLEEWIELRKRNEEFDLSTVFCSL